jgi:hypothetical protein
MNKNLLTLLFILFAGVSAFAQPDDLLNELNDLTKDEPKKPNYTFATFKGVRLINGQSVEAPAKGELLYMLQHRFGTVENGFYDMFGMDRATMRMGLEYTLPFDFVTIGYGRSTYHKTYDGFIKAKIFRQQSGAKNFPVTISWVSDMAVRSEKFANTDRKNYFSSRIAYMHQLLIARKFSSSFSMQISPTLIHKNLVKTIDEQNTFFSMGVGGRIKLTRRVSLNLEYFGFLPGQNIPKIGGSQKVHNTVAVGFDIETGGHVFQLQFTNALAMYDGGYITETGSDFFSPKGTGFGFGFNLTRTFSFKKRTE